jgi:hypothetical protein
MADIFLYGHILYMSGTPGRLLGKSKRPSQMDTPEPSSKKNSPRTPTDQPTRPADPNQTHILLPVGKGEFEDSYELFIKDAAGNLEPVTTGIYFGDDANQNVYYSYRRDENGEKVLGENGEPIVVEVLPELIGYDKFERLQQQDPLLTWDEYMDHTKRRRIHSTVKPLPMQDILSTTPPESVADVPQEQTIVKPLPYYVRGGKRRKSRKQKSKKRSTRRSKK